MKNPIVNYFKAFVFGIVLTAGFLFLAPVDAARTGEVWQERLGSYLETVWSEGRNILINGSNKYLNFGSVSGSSGYGFRDSGGTMQFKDSGGSWAAFGAGGGSGTVTSVDMSVPTGLTIAGNPITTSGTLALTLTAGYNIPLTASTTAWNNFLKTPSTIITAGTGIDWSGNTLNGVYTAGDGLTLTGEDFDFDGGASPAGALGGTWASPTVDDDGHAHTGATLSAIVTGDITDGTLIEPDLDVDDSPSDGEILTYDTTGTNFVWETILALVNGITGAVDWGSITSFEIPNGASPTVDATGECALDTTDDQLKCADGAGTARVFATDEFRVISVTVASTSLAFTSGQSLAALGHKDGIEITQYRCYVVGGTSKVINLTDGTNDTETITCGTTMTSDTDVATNDTFTADELGYMEFGATTGTVNWLHFEAYARITAE